MGGAEVAEARPMENRRAGEGDNRGGDTEMMQVDEVEEEAGEHVEGT